MTSLTEQFHLPEQYNNPCQRLTKLVAEHAQRLLAQEYWTPEHLEGIQEHIGQSYTYIRDNPTNLFEQTEEYLYSRFKRCIYARVARKHFDQCKMEEANPVAYTEAGNHASFPSHYGSQFSRLCARSTGVQSTTDQQDSKASGRQTQEFSSRARSLIVKSGETNINMGGLYKNRGSNTGMRVSRGSILENALLAERCQC